MSWQYSRDPYADRQTSGGRLVSTITSVFGVAFTVATAMVLWQSIGLGGRSFDAPSPATIPLMAAAPSASSATEIRQQGSGAASLSGAVPATVSYDERVKAHLSGLEFGGIIEQGNQLVLILGRRSYAVGDQLPGGLGLTFVGGAPNSPAALVEDRTGNRFQIGG